MMSVSDSKSGTQHRFPYPRQCIVTPGVLSPDRPLPRNWFDWHIAGTDLRRILRWTGDPADWTRVRQAVCPWLAHPVVLLSSYADPLLLALQGEDRKRFRFVVLENPVDMHEYLSTPDPEIIRAWSTGLVRRSRRRTSESLDLPADLDLLTAYGRAFQNWAGAFYPELQPSQRTLRGLSGEDFNPLCKRGDTHWYAHRAVPMALLGVRSTDQGPLVVSEGALAGCSTELTPAVLTGRGVTSPSAGSHAPLSGPRGLLIDIRPVLTGWTEPVEESLKLAADHGGTPLTAVPNAHLVQHDPEEGLTVELQLVPPGQLRVTLLTERRALANQNPSLRVLEGEVVRDVIEMPPCVPDEWKPGQWVSAMTLAAARLRGATALQVQFDGVGR